MKNILAIAAFILISSHVSAQQVFFVKAALGPSGQGDNSFAGGDINYSPSGMGALTFSLGLNVGPQFLAEMEWSSRSVSIDSIDGANYLGDLDTGAFMFNGIYKLPLQNGYSLFAGAGFGVITAELNDIESGNTADGSAFGTQIILGFEASINYNLDFTVEYKRLAAMDLELTGTSGIFQQNFDFNNDSVLIGLKYNF